MRAIFRYVTLAFENDIPPAEKKDWKKRMSKKIFLLDTNVLLHDPKSIYNFAPAIVGIPGVVLEELDTFKKEGTDRGRNSREVIRQLDALREKGSLREGVDLGNGSKLLVFFMKEAAQAIPFKLPIEDNEVLLIANSLKDEGYDVRFISKDINARVKADALGIHAEDYLHEFVTPEQFYKGWVRLSVPSVQLKQEVPKLLEEYAQEYLFAPNEFALIESNNNPHNYRVFRFVGGSKKFVVVNEPQFKWPLHPRNAQQLMALDLLLDPSVQLVSLIGPAGTGKTFLALLAGLHETLVLDEYEKILIARPVVPLGRDIGYLPGTLQEKLYTWMLPVYDNMEYIVHAAHGSHMHAITQEQQEPYRKFRGKKRNFQKMEKKHDESKLLPLEDMVRWGKISLEAITYMRGRSIPYQYIIIDEVQNLTPHEVKTLVSRVGEGSKIILAGDPYQIDVPYLDFSSNGLIITSEKFKGQSLFGAVYLETTERSTLSQLASELL